VPTYGYRCPACSTEFEVLQRMTDEAVANCPHCGAPSRRLFYPTGIVFKGSGFYATDSRRGSSGAGSAGSSGTKVAASSDADKAAAGETSGGEKTPAGGTSGADRGTTAPGSDGPAAGTGTGTGTSSSAAGKA
jgi:putative FmdB family regulatory protein